MLIWLISALSILCNCDFIYNVTQAPTIVEKGFEIGTTICINSSLPGMAVIFSHWENANITTYHAGNLANLANSSIQSGPYKFQFFKLGAVDFGSSYGSVDIMMRGEGTLSFGAFTFPYINGYRVISSHPKDNFTVSSKDTNDEDAKKKGALKFEPNMHFSYFNTGFGLMKYEINANLGKDTLQITQSKPSGLVKRQITGSSEDDLQTTNLVFFTCETGNELISSEELVIEVQADDYHPTRVSRFVGYPNGNYTEILSDHYYEQFSPGIIAAIIISVILVIVIIVGVSLYLKAHKVTDSTQLLEELNADSDDGEVPRKAKDKKKNKKQKPAPGNQPTACEDLPQRESNQNPLDQKESGTKFEKSREPELPGPSPPESSQP